MGSCLPLKSLMVSPISFMLTCQTSSYLCVDPDRPGSGQMHRCQQAIDLWVRLSRIPSHDITLILMNPVLDSPGV